MHHSLDICYDIAEKLKGPEKISALMQEKARQGGFLGDEWSEFSLATGFPGIICFYGMMHLNFENEGWDVVAHDYIKYIKTYLETAGQLDVSLFFGLAGWSLAVYFCSDNSRRYTRMLSQLDDLLIQDVRKRFPNQSPTYSDPYTLVPSNYYNLARGLSGIISYSLLREELKELTQQCVESLVKVLSLARIVDSHEVLAWTITPQSIDYFEIGPAYSGGYYSLRVPYGIPGVLGVLSHAAIKGIRVDGLHELIQGLAQWIRTKQRVKDTLIYWNSFVPKEENFKIDENVEGYYWKLGTLGVAKSLDLASQALGDQELQTYSERVFLSHLASFYEWPKSIDTSFLMGKAGLLSLVYNMGCERKNPFYFKIAKEIEEDLKKSYNPLYPFGFRSLNLGLKEKQALIDTPGLLQGAVGIGLALLEVQGRVKSPWNQVFLLS